MLQQEQQQAQATLERSLRTQTQGDMASLLARYGSQLALAQSGGAAISPVTGTSMLMSPLTGASMTVRGT